MWGWVDYSPVAAGLWVCGGGSLLWVAGLCGLVVWGVWVLFVNSIVCLFVFVLCLFFVFECFWLGLLTGFSGWFFWALTFLFLFGEFDPGSGRTLAACLTHASRAGMPLEVLRDGRRYSSGGRVSNA